MKILTIIVLLSSTILSSCISSKKIDKFVHRYYLQNEIQHQNDKINWLYNSQNISSIDTFSISERTKAQLIPAILYYQWHTNVNTDLNNQIVIDRFNNYLISKSDLIQLPILLDKNKIEFEFTEAPSGFSYIRKGNLIFLIVAYTVRDLNAIEPTTIPYSLKFRVLNQQNEIINEGEVKVENTEIPILNIWKSPKKFTWAYIDEYHRHQDKAFFALIEKIENELKK